MAIVGSVFAMLGRFAGRLLNSALGWATILLFGKVEGRRQTFVLVMALGSLVWVVTFAGVLYPDIAAFVLTFVPVPNFVDDTWIRITMLAAAVALPLLIGVGAIVITDEGRRPKGVARLTAVLRGYPFAFVLAVTIAFLGVVAGVRKVRSLTRRWQDAHVPVVVKPGGYDRVVADLESVLDEAGLDVRREAAPAVLSVPPRLLDAVAGKSLGALVPDRLVVLKGQGLDILVYPSDIAIAGSKDRVARARAAIASKLTESPAYMTTSAQAERLEDRITALLRLDPAAARTRLVDLDREIARLAVPFDEWETVYRERLQVERNLLAREADGRLVDRPGTTDLAPVPGGGLGGRLLGWAIGLVSSVLLAVDIGLLLRRRRD
ncbi:MAG TPA: hypothetical protein VL749_01895 [Patescibacteria group bacterium]|nr:hypothetical protein [Patescibacteria group bacterium]